MDNLREKHWHHHPKDELEKLLESDAQQGLSQLEVEERHLLYGNNQLSPPAKKSELLLFLLQFHQPLVYILLAAAIVTFLLQEWVDSGVIFAVILINALVGFIQERKASKAVEALSNAMQGYATVIREGIKTVIPAKELVLGDLVLLQSGDKVPADIRLVQCRELQIDESALTGESVPVQKNLDALPIDTSLAERKNMAYSSTLVTYGTAQGFVAETGDHTEIGQINSLIAHADILSTPLTQKIAEFSRLLLVVIMLLASLTFIIGWLHGQSLLDTFMAAVALAVGAIPEGLPAAISIILAIGVNKMASRHAIIRKMPAVETLGSTTVICSDKTGTLTQNQMTVQEIYAATTAYDLSGVGYQPQGDIYQTKSASQTPQEKSSSSNSENLLSQNQALKETLMAGLLCNDSQLIEQAGQWKINGDPTEAALITSAAKAQLKNREFEVSHPRQDTLPFESQHQYMATLHNLAHPNNSANADQNNQIAQQVVYVKGSVESIVKRCHKVLNHDGLLIKINPEQILKEVENMASKGLRVLAFAKKSLPKNQRHISHETINKELIFLGLQAMMDPPREEAIKAVAACQNAGIKIKMITGDHIATAAAIAKQIKIQEAIESESQDYAYKGRDLAHLSDAELVEIVQKTAVFARVSPEQKLRLVHALQTNGHIVAMTGDGVNDAPALKQANIGIAMGMGGTEVAKEAADMILTNDNFATIEAAVEEGRSVFDNLIKFITWTLPTNAGEGLVILTAILLGITLPITPVQILWINMTTAVLLGMMLAFEAKQPGLMLKPPRKPQSPLINRPLVMRVILVSTLLLLSAYGLFSWALASGESIETARTLAVNVFVFGEIFYLFNCRSLEYSPFKIGFFSNRWLLVGVLSMLLLQLLFTYHPMMQTLFGSAALNPAHWAAILSTSLIIFSLVEMEKWLKVRNG